LYDNLMNILLIEDNPGHARLLQASLAEDGGNGFAVTHVSSLDAGVCQLRRHPAQFGAVLLDLYLPDSQGLDTVDRVRQAAPELPIIVLTSLEDEDIGVEAVRRGAQDYLVKGQADGRLLSRAIRYATERKQAQEQLEQANAILEERIQQRTAELSQTVDVLQTEVTERRRLEKEVLEIGSLEQQRIGRDLHDGLGQLLTAATFMAKMLEQRLQEKGQAEASHAADIGRIVKSALQKTRALSRGLNPIGLTTGGLAKALEALAANTTELFEIDCRCECDPTAQIQDANIATHTYHIAQEAVNNAVKHSQARSIAITLVRRDLRHLALAVTDDGLGLPDELDRSKGLGLHIMEYRANMVSGTLTVRRGASSGTEVQCTFPVPVERS
jgi:signal transduction histidine kinase